MWTNDEIRVFAQQAGLIDAAGNVLDMDRLLNTAIQMEVPIATLGGALGWSNAQIEAANSRVLWWEIQRDLQTYPAHMVRETWAQQRGVAPSMFNRIYSENTGSDVPEPVNVAPPAPAPQPAPAVVFTDGQPNLYGRDLLRYDAAALGLSTNELLYRVYRSSIDKGIPLAVVRQQIADKYAVSPNDLDSIIEARNPGIVDRYQAEDDARAQHVAWQAQPVPSEGLKPYPTPAPAPTPAPRPAPAPPLGVPLPPVVDGEGNPVRTIDPGAPLVYASPPAAAPGASSGGSSSMLGVGLLLALLALGG